MNTHTHTHTNSFAQVVVSFDDYRCVLPAVLPNTYDKNQLNINDNEAFSFELVPIIPTEKSFDVFVKLMFIYVTDIIQYVCIHFAFITDILKQYTSNGSTGLCWPVLYVLFAAR